MEADRLSRELGLMVVTHPLEEVLGELRCVRAAGVFSPQAFLDGLSQAAAGLPNAACHAQLAAADALQAAGVSGAAPLLVAACGSARGAAAALKAAACSATASAPLFRRLFASLLRAAGAAPDEPDGSAAAGGDGCAAWQAGAWGHGCGAGCADTQGDAAAEQLLGLLSEASDDNEALHARMFEAVASELLPLDERMAHAWTLGQVRKLLGPDDPANCRKGVSHDAGGGDGSGGSTGGSGAPAPWLLTAASPADAAEGGAGGGGAGAGCGPWRGEAWWTRALPSVVACVEPDELLDALTERLPRAGGGLAGQRAAAGLAAALLRRSARAARNTIERIAGCILGALDAGDQAALQSVMLVARLTLYHEDYRDLLYSSLDRHRRRATAPDAAAAAGAAGAAAGAASGGGAGGAARALAQFLSAIRALCPAAPRLELEAYSRVLSRVAQEWGAAADAARQQRAEVADILKTCIKDQEAAKQDEGARLPHVGDDQRAQVERTLKGYLDEFRRDAPAGLPAKHAHVFKLFREDFRRLYLPLLMVLPSTVEAADVQHRYLLALASHPATKEIAKDAPGRFLEDCEAVGLCIDGARAPLKPGAAAAAAAGGDTPLGRLVQLVDRLPVLAAKGGGAQSAMAKLLERLQMQLRDVLDRYHTHQQQQQRQRQSQPQQHISQAPSGGPLRPGGGNVPTGAEAREAKRQKVDPGGSGGGGAGGSGGDGGGAGSGGGWRGADGAGEWATPRELVDVLLAKYTAACERAAAAAAAGTSGGGGDGGGGGSGGAQGAAGAAGWRLQFAGMVQGVPELHDALIDAIAAHAERGALPQPQLQASAPERTQATQKGAAGAAAAAASTAAAAGLLACMCACQRGRERGAGATPAAAGAGVIPATGCEAVTLEVTQPCHSWACSSPAGADVIHGSDVVYGAGWCPSVSLVHKLPASAWPPSLQDTAPGAGSGPRRATAAGAGAGAGAGGGSGARVPGSGLCCEVMRRAGLGDARRLAGTAAFWCEYLGQVAALGWWTTGGTSGELSDLFPAPAPARPAAAAAHGLPGESRQLQSAPPPPANSLGPAAAAGFVPPELPGLLAWLSRRLTLSSSGSEDEAAAARAAAQACRDALSGAICRQLRPWRPACAGGGGGGSGGADGGGGGRAGPWLAAEAVRWEAKALADGLPVPAALLQDAAAAVVRGLGMGGAADGM